MRGCRFCKPKVGSSILSPGTIFLGRVHSIGIDSKMSGESRRASGRQASRYDKLAASYLAFIKLASIRIWLRANESGA